MHERVERVWAMKNEGGARDGAGSSSVNRKVGESLSPPESTGRDYRRARELLWMAAHDLAAPLAAARTHLRAKERQHRAQPLSGEQWLAACGRIDKLVTNALTMIDDVLAVERLSEHPSAAAAPFPIVDAEAVLAEVIFVNAVSLERAGCSVFVSRGDDLNQVRGRWNQTSLERLFSNLIQNVVHHAPGAPIEVSFARRDDLLQIRFADGGPGLTSEKRRLGGEALADAAFGDEGHGLGLWIVYRIVAELGGEVTMQSRAGKGLTFDIRLPFGT